MTVAKVAVSAAIYSIDKLYSYRIPESLSEFCVPGVRVIVPFGRGNRRSEGMIALCTDEPTDGLKTIERVLDHEPVMDEKQLRLAAFIRERCFCTMFTAIRAMLPAGLWFSERIRVTALQSDQLSTEGLCSEEAEKLLAYIRAADGCELSRLKELFGAEKTDALIEELRRYGLCSLEEDFKRKALDKTEQIAVLEVPQEDCEAYMAAKKGAKMQIALLNMLIVLGRCSVKELFYYTGASKTSLNALERAGLISYECEETFRRPDYTPAADIGPIVLQEEQENAYRQLSEELHGEKKRVSLLYGVTGSGKTMVYLRLIEDTLAMGKTALFLLPEIALTPQMVSLFLARFGDSVAVIHSGLQMTRRYDEWKRIRRGLARVVIGTRSAVFAPLENLGLIILDEEHEASYKSSEMTPRYHAREVAIYRGAREGAAVILGSATPSVKSMYLAESGIYRLVTMKNRYNHQKLPEVLITDMKQELKNGNSGAISACLREELKKNLDAGEQSILFLNRRGASTSVVCPMCGYVPSCTRCSVSLTYHAANGRLMCHYCGYSLSAGESCPKCGSTFKRIGVGTQRVEEEIHQMWPHIPLLRMDADTVTATNSHEKILSRFRDEKVPILIGTQMVTKGLNFPNVTLVGVVDGDSSMYMDDYQASETTFSRITQVVGRAGRGDRPGRAIIQTMTPENQVLLQAAAQDYDSFYRAELPLRKLQNSPPFLDEFRISFSGQFERDTSRCALLFREELNRLFRSREWAGEKLVLMGPSPERVVRVMNRYRYQLTLLARGNKALRALLSDTLRRISSDKRSKGVSLSIDVNPMG